MTSKASKTHPFSPGSGWAEESSGLLFWAWWHFRPNADRREAEQAVNFAQREASMRVPERTQSRWNSSFRTANRVRETRPSPEKSACNLQHKED